MVKRSKKPYSQKSDTEKLKSNWTKTISLYKRGEYSVSIIRAATTVEISANLIIRAELIENRRLSKEFVDHLLMWANGLQGKYEKLILPILKDTPKHTKFMTIKGYITEVNKHRNSVVHSGEFRSKKIADKVLKNSHKIIITFVTEYDINFYIKEI